MGTLQLLQGVQQDAATYQAIRIPKGHRSSCCSSICCFGGCNHRFHVGCQAFFQVFVTCCCPCFLLLLFAPLLLLLQSAAVCCSLFQLPSPEVSFLTSRLQSASDTISASSVKLHVTVLAWMSRRQK